jgi:hypothetical protein
MAVAVQDTGVFRTWREPLFHAKSLQSAVWISLSLALACGGDATRKSNETRVSPATEAKLEDRVQPAQTPARSSAAPQSVAPPAAPSGDLCATICRHATNLACGSAADCSRGCQEMLATPICREQTRGFFACIAGETSAHWECDGNTGMPAIKDGYCSEPQRAFFDCLEHT